MPRNRFDYIDNTVHETTALDRAQKDWYDKVKKSAFGNQEIGTAMFGPKPSNKNNNNTEDMGKYQERFTPREDSTGPLLGYDTMAASVSGSSSIDSRGFDFKPFENSKRNSDTPNQFGNLVSPDTSGSSIPQNNFIPPATQNNWSEKWDGIRTEENFRIAREDGSNPVPNPPDTTVNLDRKGTMNNLFSSSLT